MTDDRLAEIRHHHDIRAWTIEQNPDSPLVQANGEIGELLEELKFWKQRYAELLGQQVQMEISRS